MLLTVLGCSGSVPGPDSPASGYLVEADGFQLVVDFGNGVLASLLALRDPFDMGALLLSHLHPDHCVDVALLTVMRRYHPDPPYDATRRRLPVYAPAEAPTRFAAAYAPDVSQLAVTDLTDIFDFHPLTESTVRIGPFDVTSVRVAHSCEAYGFRISHGGASLVYTGDSGPCESLGLLAMDADVLLAEASWTHAPDRKANLHMSGWQAGDLAATAGAGRLLLTHVPPWTDANAVLAEAKEGFTGSVDLVHRGATYQIG